MALIVYILLTNRQLKRMSEILDRRRKEQTSQIVSVDMTNQHINRLANCINECLKTEENFRLTSVKEEKRFKELISNISHDLRTPLTSIKGYQQMLQKEHLSKEQQGKLLIAMKHTDILGQRIERFFEYTYLENHTPVCNLEKINLTNQVAEYLASSITMLEDNGIVVNYDDSTQVHVLADKEYLGRIVQNLISNCVQHACGIIYVSIITDTVNKNGTMAGVSFRNKVETNHNIHVERLFDRFYTADYARNQSTGLGLAIVKRLTEHMNGNVSAEIIDGMLDLRVMFPMS